MERPDDPKRREAIRILQAGLSDLRTDPMGEEQMMELIGELKREKPTRRLPLPALAAAAAAVLLALVVGGGAWLFSGGDPAVPGSFAEGPQVADADSAEVRPPPLRVPRSPSWDHESYRALLTVRGDLAKLRLSYEPADGIGRVRDSSVITPVAPRPKDAPENTLVAVLLSAGAEEPWRNLRLAMSGPQSVLYLAGLEPAETLGAVAAIVPRSAGERAAMQEIQRLGAAVTMQDLSGAFPPERVLQLRITREGGRTRFRFGLHPYSTPAALRFGLGDHFFSDAELVARGDGPLLPELDRWVSGSGARATRTLIFLEVGTGVRYLDVLRAVESAQGAWILDLGVPRVDLLNLKLPEALSPEDAKLLSEGPGEGLRQIITVSEDGRIHSRKRVLEADAVDLGGPGTEVWLRADRSAPFSVCRQVLKRAAETGCASRIMFAPEDPEIRWERGVVLPPGSEVEESIRVEMRLGADGAWMGNDEEAGPGKGIVLAVPQDATAGQVLPLLLNLVRRGVSSIRFE